MFGNINVLPHDDTCHQWWKDKEKFEHKNNVNEKK
jgi:hypothetical protein